MQVRRTEEKGRNGETGGIQAWTEDRKGFSYHIINNSQ